MGTENIGLFKLTCSLKRLPLKTTVLQIHKQTYLYVVKWLSTDNNQFKLITMF